MFWLLFFMLTLAVTHVNCKYASPCFTPNQQAGLCMPVKSCKPIYDLLKHIEDRGGTISDYDKAKLATFHCGTFKTITHVCCPKNKIQLNVVGLNILKNNTCGVYSEKRILNGMDVAPFQFPWMALLKYKDHNFKCVGTLISDQYVLTAAHCIKRKEHLLKEVRLGEYQISTEIDSTNSAPTQQCAPPVKDVGIEEVITHEHFQNIYNDIALIRLNRKVEFKSHIKPICLPIYEHLRSKEYKYYTITEWGITEESQSSDILKSAFLLKVNRTECENKWRKFNLYYPLNSGHICAGDINLVNSCQGDSGGPLGYIDLYDEGTRFIQFGILSIRLYRCEIDNVPVIYTNVAHYMQWITDNLKEASVKESNQVVSCTTPTLENGFCVPYNECPFVKELQQNYSSYDEIPKYYINDLIKSRCSHNNEPIRLCCEFPNENDRTYTSTTANSVITSSNAFQKLAEDSKNNRQYNFSTKSELSCITPTLEDGFCVPYKECLFLNELIQTFGSSTAIPKFYINLIMQSKCSHDNEPIRLCCKVSGTTRSSSTKTTAVPRDILSTTDPTLTEDLNYNKDFISQFNQKGLKILNALSCGNSGGDRVAGGNETDLAEYPWMALLRSDNAFICGGTLISNRHVLTATHCVNKVVYPIISVRLGEHDIRTNPDCRQNGKKYVCNPVTEDFGIEKIIPHPRYSGKTRINDIALIKLARNVVFKKHIKPICLPITEQSFEIKSTTFTIAGWGVTEISTKSSVLLKAEVLAYSHSVCQNVFSNLIKVNNKHICAGDLQTRRGTCRGDSGGPLVAFNTYSTVKHFIQYGIIAHGGEACNLQQGFPGIYTNVLTYLPWITNNIVD